MQTDIMQTFRWLRVVGDTVFAAGALALAAFVIGLRTGATTERGRFHVAEPLTATRP